MKTLDLISWPSGLVYGLGTSLMFLLAAIFRSGWDFVETVESMVLFGLLAFAIGGLLGNKLWRYRWFKMISAVFVVELCLIPIDDLNGIRFLVSLLLIPLLSFYFTIFRSPLWLRSLSIGICTPFWPLFLYTIIFTRSMDTGLTLIFIVIPATIIGALIGLVVGVVLTVARNKSAV